MDIMAGYGDAGACYNGGVWRYGGGYIGGGNGRRRGEGSRRASASSERSNPVPKPAGQTQRVKPSGSKPASQNHQKDHQGVKTTVDYSRSLALSLSRSFLFFAMLCVAVRYALARHAQARCVRSKRVSARGSERYRKSVDALVSDINAVRQVES
eukprot:1232786-Rhodomonas_salina.4